MKKLITTTLLIMFVTSLSMGQDVRINEVGTTVDVNGETKWIEFKNVSNSEVDLSNYPVCIEPSYPTIGSFTVLAGNDDHTIPPDGFLVVAWDQLGTSEGELGLYQEGTSGFSGFGNAENIIDYMQYGADGSGRDDVADQAGIWIEDDFAPAVEMEQTFSFFEDSNDDPVDNWKAGSPTPGEPNEEATSTSVDDVNTVADKFEIIGNFPNPFNPSTTIQFNLPSAASVQLQVYNVIGSEVMTIDAGRFSAGTGNQIQVNAQNLASGTYIYRLTARTSNQILQVSDTFTLIK